MSNYNAKNLVDVRVTFLYIQKEYYTNNLEGGRLPLGGFIQQLFLTTLL